MASVCRHATPRFRVQQSPYNPKPWSNRGIYDWKDCGRYTAQKSVYVASQITIKLCYISSIPWLHSRNSLDTTSAKTRNLTSFTSSNSYDDMIMTWYMLWVIFKLVYFCALVWLWRYLNDVWTNWWSFRQEDGRTHVELLSENCHISEKQQTPTGVRVSSMFKHYTRPFMDTYFSKTCERRCWS